MSSKRMVVVVAAMALLLLSVGLVLPAAHEERLASGTEVIFLTLLGTPVITLPNAVLNFNGPSQGTTADVGNCLSAFPSGTFGQLQHVVLVHAGSYSGPLGEVVATHVNGTADPAPIPPGTRIGSLDALGTCGSSGEFQRWRGFVE